MPTLRHVGSTPTFAELCESLLRRPIAFHRAFADIGGGATAGLFLSQAWYWTQHTQAVNGWFYKTQGEWEEETALTRREQDHVRHTLKSLGILEEKRQGQPARLWYKIDLMVVQTRLAESAKLDWRKAPNYARVKDPDSDVLSPETTTEIKDPPKVPHAPKTKATHDASLNVLGHLCTITGRQYRSMGLIAKVLTAGASQEDCILVLDWLHIERRRTEPDWVAQYLDHTTPFRPGNFDKYLARAQEWTAQGRTTPHAPNKLAY